MISKLTACVLVLNALKTSLNPSDQCISISSIYQRLVDYIPMVMAMDLRDVADVLDGREQTAWRDCVWHMNTSVFTSKTEALRGLIFFFVLCLITKDVLSSVAKEISTSKNKRVV